MELFAFYDFWKIFLSFFIIIIMPLLMWVFVIDQ